MRKSCFSAKYLETLTRLENLVIQDAEKLKLEAFDDFKNIKPFKISFLPQLETLPQWLGKFSRLQKLEISLQFIVISARGNVPPERIEEIGIHHCPKLSERRQPQKGED